MTSNVYSLTALLIDLGGISRAFYTGGFILAHFIAKHLYKAALISDLFMVQEEGKKPHPTYEPFITRADLDKDDNDDNEKDKDGDNLSISDETGSVISVGDD